MYREDRHLEMADLQLRLFIEYCKELPIIFADLIELELATRRMNTSSIIKPSENYRLDDRFIDILDKRDKALDLYKQRLVFIRSITKILRSLDSEEIVLLQNRYEKNLTLRKLGDIYNYSYMNMSRRLDEVLKKFCDL